MGADWTAIRPPARRRHRDADYDTFPQGTLKVDYPWMPRDLRRHYGRLYGTRIRRDCGRCDDRLTGLGRHFGGTSLRGRGATISLAHEWAQTAEDILWRRTKHRLHLSEAEQSAFTEWFDAAQAEAA